MHIFCSNPSVVVDLEYELHFMVSLFKFCEKKYISRFQTSNNIFFLQNFNKFSKKYHSHK